MIIVSFLHLVINWHNIIERVSLLFLVLMNDFKFNLI